MRVEVGREIGRILGNEVVRMEVILEYCAL